MASSSIQSSYDNSYHNGVSGSGQHNINKTDKSVSEVAKETFSFLRSSFMSAFRSVPPFLIGGFGAIVRIILFPVSLISTKPDQMVVRAGLTAFVFLGLIKKENKEHVLEPHKRHMEKCHTFDERAAAVADGIGRSLSHLTVFFLMSPIHAIVATKGFFEKIKGE